MPSLDNNGMDDPLILDGNLSFVGGQNSFSRSNAVPENGYFEALNMDYDVFGGIVTRRGAAQLVGDVVDYAWEDVSSLWNSTSQYWSDTFTAPIRDIFYFDSSAGEYIAVADGSNTIKFSSETAATAVIASSTYSGNNVYFAQLTDRLYFCDGSSTLQYITASSTLTSISAGRITSVEVTNGGSAYTSAPAVTAAGGGSGATFTAILGPNGVVVGITVTAQGSAYTNGTILTIGAPPSGGVLATADARISQQPSQPKLLISHTNRLIAASSVAAALDTVYVSDILDGESWDLISNSIRVGGGDGDPITALFPWHGFRLLVFKERSVWVIDANPSMEVADWEVKLISNRVGCVAHKSVQQVGSDVFFLSREGVQSLSTIESGAQTGISLPISAPVHDEIESINKDFHSRCSATYYRNRYFLSYPTTTSTVDSTLVFNTLVKAWSGKWDGWKPRAYTTTAFGGKIRMMFGDEDGKLFTWLDYIDDDEANESYYLDQGVLYASQVATRSYNFGEKYGDKFGYQVEFDLDNPFLENQLVNFSHLVNLAPLSSCLISEDSFGTLLTELGDCASSEFIEPFFSATTIPSTTGLFRKSFNLQSKGRFSEIQFVVRAESGRLSLHSVKASAFADTIRPER